MLDPEGEPSQNPPLEPHEERVWHPDIKGHRQRGKRRLGKKIQKQLEERTDALREEILGNQGESET